jgi:DNA-3-methyladenine glycosylase II
MFALCREDLFAIDDLGLQQAVIGLYDLKHRKKKIMHAKILKIAEQWAPLPYLCLLVFVEMERQSAYYKWEEK